MCNKSKTPTHLLYTFYYLKIGEDCSIVHFDNVLVKVLVYHTGKAEFKHRSEQQKHSHEFELSSIVLFELLTPNAAYKELVRRRLEDLNQLTDFASNCSCP